MKFYIGIRHNPQLDRPYIKKYGQLSAKKAKETEKCKYGTLELRAFETEKQYLDALVEYEAQGFKVL